MIHDPAIASARNRATRGGDAPGGPTAAFRASVVLVLLLIVVATIVLPHGEMRRDGRVVLDPETGERRFVHDDGHGLRTAGAILGQLSVMALAPSLLLGYDLPLLRRVAPAARLRWHARLGGAVLALAVLHTALLLANGDLRGWAPGALALALLAAHGATGALKRRLLRTWGGAWWRYAHRATAWASLALVADHVLIASWHWGAARWFAHNGW